MGRCPEWRRTAFRQLGAVSLDEKLCLPLTCDVDETLPDFIGWTLGGHSQRVCADRILGPTKFLIDLREMIANLRVLIEQPRRFHQPLRASGVATREIHPAEGIPIG